MTTADGDGVILDAGALRCPNGMAKLAPALVAALAEIADPVKGGKARVPNRGEYSYLTLPQLLDAAREPMGRHKLALLQTLARVEGGLEVTTIVLHESGETMVVGPLGLRCGPSAQEVGSASTYGRRYQLAALLGLAGAEDDDGAHTGSGQQTAGRTTPVQVKRPEPAPPEVKRPEPTPQPQPGDGVTPAQMRKIGALLGEMERLDGRKLDRDERRGLIAAMAGHPDPDSLQSAKELTKAQASAAIERLTEAVAEGIDVPQEPQDS